MDLINQLNENGKWMATKNKPPIVFLTDFGNTDPYTGIMKGIISRIAPQASLIDLTNAIPPGDIQKGAMVLWQSITSFPEGSIFLCVIDPGVGSSRKGIVMQTRQYLFVGPDNGLFSFITDTQTSTWELANPKYQNTTLSHTFHGRDLFAPAAAYLWNGVSPSDFGTPVSTPVTLPRPCLQMKACKEIKGEILYFDHFGNAITSIGVFEEEHVTLNFRDWLDGKQQCSILKSTCKLHVRSNTKLSLASTFSDIPDEQCAMIIGSSGLIEIVANQDSARELLGLERGEEIILTCEPANGGNHG